MKRVLMVRPDHFRIEYAINPFMTDASGKLKTIDHDLAMQQWQNLRQTYQSLGFSVEVITGAPELPDMVFAANQSLVFGSESHPRCVISKMRFQSRQPEVEYFAEWYQSQNYEILRLPDEGEIYGFEGNGDALPIPERNLLIGGIGPRTDAKVYPQLAKITGMKIVQVEPVERHFYHLDTCLSVLSPDTIAVVEKVFDRETVVALKKEFTVITIDQDEAIYGFAGNAHCPDGKHVIIQQGNDRFCDKLTKAGFTPVPINTGEFMKAGGSVFCMKMMVF